MNAIRPTTFLSGLIGSGTGWIFRAIQCGLLFFLAGLPVAAVDYRVVTPRMGEPFEVREGREGTWRTMDVFVRQIEGKTRVVHSTLTGLADGDLLITMPERSTLLRIRASRLFEQTR